MVGRATEGDREGERQAGSSAAGNPTGRTGNKKSLLRVRDPALF
jgi:hypothetical protein